MKHVAQFRSPESVYNRFFICPHRQPPVTTSRCSLHTIPPRLATVTSIMAVGPPPPTPATSVENADSRVERRKKQAEMLKRGQELRAAAGVASGGTTNLKRFWKHVYVKKTEDGFQIHLDQRPLRTPSKQILTIPHHKPHLASAIALEWDLLISAQQALKQHLIPLTSLVARALDINEEDESTSGAGQIRTAITETVMRYLVTDSLLCWAPEPPADPPGYETHARRSESLRSVQARTAKEIVTFLTERVWPGVKIVPVLDGDSIIPQSQPEMTLHIIRGWVSGLPGFELAGLERAVLAGKSLLGAARLLVEWSTELRYLRGASKDAEGAGNGKRFGIEEAARAASLEVTYQTEKWGMVEDTHDVDHEDLRRQLGSVILLVSGEEA